MARPNIRRASLFLAVQGGTLENRMNVCCSVLNSFAETFSVRFSIPLTPQTHAAHTSRMGSRRSFQDVIQVDAPDYHKGSSLGSRSVPCLSIV